MKKTTKPYITFLRTCFNLWSGLTFDKNRMHIISPHFENATLPIKTLALMIYTSIASKLDGETLIGGQVDKYFMKFLGKPYILFGRISYICARVLDNWGVVFFKRLIAISLTMMDYLKQSVNPFGSRLFYSDVKLVTLNFDSFSSYLSVDPAC